MFLLELVLVLGAHLHHRLHVDLVERGQDGRSGLRLHQALGDACTQARHWHALLGTLTKVAHIDRRHRPRRCRSRSRSWRFGATLRGLDNIAFGDPAATTGAAEGIRIDVLFGSHFLRRRHRRRSRGCFCRSGCRSRRCDNHCFCLARLGFGIGIDGGDDLAAGHRAAVGLDDLHQYAGLRGRGFEHHLVGLDIHQVLVAFDVFTGLFVPRHEGRLGNGLRELGHFHINKHDYSVNL